VTIRSARAEEVPAVGELIAVAFDDLAANAYLVPPPADRVPVMAGFFALLTEVAAEHGRIDVVDGPSGLAGTAVWFDYTAEMPEPAGYDPRLAALAGPYRAHFDALDHLFAAHHPHPAHWHLAFLAVHPASQRAGLGGALMRRTHHDLDRSGVPAYLEATNEDNIRLYRRHGYADMVPFEINLPDGAPFFRMWRDPGGGARPRRGRF
jgi:ribosomal protein S18 acetylase RimI-like enzyme